MIFHNGHGQAVVAGAALQLEAQTFGQVSGPHAGGIRRLQLYNGPLHHRLVHVGGGGQEGGVPVQKAVGVQPLHQKFDGPQHLRLEHVPHHELGQDVPGKVVLLVAVAPQVGQPVVPLLILTVIVGVLAVIGFQPLQPAHGVGIRRGGLRRLLRKLQGRIFLQDLLGVFPQLLYAHLQDGHGLDHLGQKGHRLFLLLLLLQRHTGPPFLDGVFLL